MNVRYYPRVARLHTLIYSLHVTDVSVTCVRECSGFRPTNDITGLVDIDQLQAHKGSSLSTLRESRDPLTTMESPRKY